MKKAQQPSPFKYYYNELLSHHGITPQNKNSIRFLIRISIMDIILFILCILLFIFRHSAIVHYFTNDSQIMHCIYAVMLIYAFITLTSYTFYHIISYNYEYRNKHELLKKDINGAYNLLFSIYKLIHLPWILLTCLTQRLLALFKIQRLKEYLPMLVCGYSYFLMIALIILQILCRYVDKLLFNYTFLTNNFITETTYLYLIVFISIIVSKHIPTASLKVVLHPFVTKNSIEYKKIFDQYHLLNYYFLVLITLILKALNFSAEDKILVDALFYTTNAMTLFSTARQKAKNTL